MPQTKPNKKIVEWYTAKQAAQLSGLTSDMVNYLCRYEIIKPTGSNIRGRGRARRFTFTDVLLLRVVSKLLDNGVSVLRLRKSLSALQKRGKKARDMLSKKYVATDGFNIYFKDNGILEIFESGQTAFAFVLELGTLRKELEKKIGQDKISVAS